MRTVVSLLILCAVMIPDRGVTAAEAAETRSTVAFETQMPRDALLYVKVRDCARLGEIVEESGFPSQDDEDTGPIAAAIGAVGELLRASRTLELAFYTSDGVFDGLLIIETEAKDDLMQVLPGVLAEGVFVVAGEGQDTIYGCAVGGTRDEPNMLYMSLREGLLYAASYRSTLEEAMAAAAAGRGHNLSDNPAYLAATLEMADSDLLVYADLYAYWSWYKSQIAEGSQEYTKAMFTEKVLNLSRVRGTAFAWDFDNAIPACRVVITTSSQRDEFAEKMSSQKEAAGILPADVSAIFTIDCGEIDSTWESLSAHVVESAEYFGEVQASGIRAIIDNMEESFALDTRRVAGALDGEVCLFLRGDGEPGFAIRVKDKTGIVAVMDELCGGALEEKQVHGITVLCGPMGEAGYMEWAVVGEFLVPVSGEESVRTFADVAASGATFEKSATYSSLVGPLPAVNVVLAYCDVGSVLNMLGGPSPVKESLSELRIAAAVTLQGDVIDVHTVSSTPISFQSILNKVLVSMTEGDSTPREEEARNALKSLGISLLLYSIDHDGNFAPGLDTLFEGGYASKKSALESPLSGERFVYLKGHRDDDPPDTILVYDATLTNAGKNLVLRVDGSVVLMDPEDLSNKLDEQAWSD